MRSYFTLVMLLYVTLAFPQPLLAAPVIVQTEVNPNNGLTYHLLSPSNWTDAEAKAVELGGTLATLRSASENDWVWATFRGATDQSRYLWVGLHRTSQWVWASSEPVTYTNWALGEPSGAPDFSAEPYVQMGYHGNPIPSAWNNLANMSEWLGTPLMGVVETAVVPEPSTCFSLAAGLVFGGLHVFQRSRRRTASVISRSIAALLVATCSLVTVPTYAVNYEMVTVGDAGNAADTTGYGAVAYDYQIGKYEVTIGQYCDFLNAVAATDAYGLYDSAMAVDQNTRGISQGSLPGASNYSLIGPSGTAPAGANSPGNRPITYVSWFDAARFANWMSNGQPTGAQGPTTTENGAYAVNGATSGAAPAINATNPNTGMAPLYRIPTESEWYKAAYYDPTLSSGFGGYWSYATRSNTVPENTLPNGSANYRHNLVFTVTQSTQLEGAQNYLTNVDAFQDAASFYDTLNQSGGVAEWNDLAGAAASVRCLRGGHYRSKTPTDISSAFRSGAVDPSDPNVQSVVGFRLAAPMAVPEPNACMGLAASLAFGGWHVLKRRRRRTAAVISRSVVVLLLAAGGATTAPTYAIDYELVPVRDAGNAADTTGYGAVNYEYRIGKYEVTIGQYAAFLNAVAKADPTNLYDPLMATDKNIAGIEQIRVSEVYGYSVIGPSGADFGQSGANRPITYVNWFDAARFANWVSNGQPTGSQDSTTTENGAYALNGATSGAAPAANAINPNTGEIPLVRIPTENEWYKAAYYRGGGSNAGYWAFATMSDASPGNVVGSGANQANYRLERNGPYAVTQSSTYSSSQNYLTDVGAFTGSLSEYGTFDQSGNVWEWNDLTGQAGGLRCLRGGYWSEEYVISMSSSIRYEYPASDSLSDWGFRLAAPIAVPEPSTCFSLAAGLVFGCWRLRCRRASDQVTG